MNCTLNRAETANFIVCVFYHNKKKKTKKARRTPGEFTAGRLALSERLGGTPQTRRNDPRRGWGPEEGAESPEKDRFMRKFKFLWTKTIPFHEV